MPKVSIIIATYSRPNLLPRAVKSAFEAGTDVEVIIVDDASTDETAEVCQKLEGIKYIRVERNQHTAGARNIGILASTAPYIGFLDDDDWRLPGSLDKQVALLDENPDYGLVYGQYLQAGQDGNILELPPEPAICEQGDLFWKLMEDNQFGCLTVVFRKECVFRLGMLDINYPGVDDWDLWVRIAELYRIGSINEPVAVWRKAESSSGQGSSDITKLNSQILKLYKTKLLQLPRVVKEDLTTSEIRNRKFLHFVYEKMIHDVAYYTKGRQRKILKLMQILDLFPSNLLKFTFYNTIVRHIIFDKDKPE